VQKKYAQVTGPTRLELEAGGAGVVLRNALVVGGTGFLATTSPEPLTPYAVCVVSGEAEELMAPLCEALARGTDLPSRMAGARGPELNTCRRPAKRICST